MTDPAAAAREAEGVRVATPDEIPALAAVMTRAFEDDPVAQWFLPDRSRWLRQMEALFDFFLRKIYMKHEACYTTPEVAGASFWVPPGEVDFGPIEGLRLVPGIIRNAGHSSPRYLRGIMLMDKHHPKDDEHWYLPLLGVAPEWQGRGLGSALLRPVLERCDRDGMPAYLEASTTRNRALYERHGFVLRGEIRFPDGPPMWPMWREPQKKEARSADLSQVHRN